MSWSSVGIVDGDVWLRTRLLTHRLDLDKFHHFGKSTTLKLQARQLCRPSELWNSIQMAELVYFKKTRYQARFW
jgi:hypothetical protein